MLYTLLLNNYLKQITRILATCLDFVFFILFENDNISWSILTYSAAFKNVVNIFGLDCKQAAPVRSTNIYFLGNTKIQAVHIFLYLYCLQNVMCS